MAASGLRSIRFLLESDCVNKIVINDLSDNAVTNIRTNIEMNQIVDYEILEINGIEEILKKKSIF